MRLTCPNCGAQYEVPDEVIPTEGRDVQCSNCGDTWFQHHASYQEPEEQPYLAEPQMQEPSSEDLRAALQGTSTPQHHETPEDTDQGPRPSEPAPVQQQMDSSVTDILREEAALEAQLRADETGNTLESQPDLGLDDIPDESERRAQEARNRMARIRGTDSEPKPHPEAEIVNEQTSRRGLLPDIEEISSTLRADGDSSAAHTAVGPVAGKRRKRSKGGFTRGVAVAILIAAALFMVYTRAPQIAQSFPQIDPALNTYVAGVDRARLWLDAKVGEFIPKQGLKP